MELDGKECWESAQAYSLPPVLEERLWTRHGECLAQHAMVWIVEFHLWCYLKTEIPDLMNCTDDRLCCTLSFVGQRTREYHLIVVEFPEDLFCAIPRVSLDCRSLRVGTANHSVIYPIHYIYFLVFPRPCENNLLTITVWTQLCSWAWRNISHSHSWRNITHFSKSVVEAMVTVICARQWWPVKLYPDREKQ